MSATFCEDDAASEGGTMSSCFAQLMIATVPPLILYVLGPVRLRRLDQLQYTISPLNCFIGSKSFLHICQILFPPGFLFFDAVNHRSHLFSVTRVLSDLFQVTAWILALLILWKEFRHSQPNNFTLRSFWLLELIVLIIRFASFPNQFVGGKYTSFGFIMLQWMNLLATLALAGLAFVPANGPMSGNLPLIPVGGSRKLQGWAFRGQPSGPSKKGGYARVAGGAAAARLLDQDDEDDYDEDDAEREARLQDEQYRLEQERMPLPMFNRQHPVAHIGRGQQADQPGRVTFAMQHQQPAAANIVVQHAGARPLPPVLRNIRVTILRWAMPEDWQAPARHLTDEELDAAVKSASFDVRVCQVCPGSTTQRWPVLRSVEDFYWLFLQLKNHRDRQLVRSRGRLSWTLPELPQRLPLGKAAGSAAASWAALAGPGVSTATPAAEQLHAVMQQVRADLEAFLTKVVAEPALCSSSHVSRFLAQLAPPRNPINSEASQQDALRQLRTVAARYANLDHSPAAVQTRARNLEIKLDRVNIPEADRGRFRARLHRLEQLAQIIHSAKETAAVKAAEAAAARQAAQEAAAAAERAKTEKAKAIAAAAAAAKTAEQEAAAAAAEAAEAAKAQEAEATAAGVEAPATTATAADTKEEEVAAAAAAAGDDAKEEEEIVPALAPPREATAAAVGSPAKATAAVAAPASAVAEPTPVPAAPQGTAATPAATVAGTGAGAGAGAGAGVGAGRTQAAEFDMMAALAGDGADTDMLDVIVEEGDDNGDDLDDNSDFMNALLSMGDSAFAVAAAPPGAAAAGAMPAGGDLAWTLGLQGAAGGGLSIASTGRMSARSALSGARSAIQKRRGSTTGTPSNKCNTLQGRFEVCQEMAGLAGTSVMGAAADGVELRDLTVRLRRLRNCFTGAAAADWILDHNYAGTRHDALVLCNVLLKADLIIFANQLRVADHDAAPSVSLASAFQDSYMCYYQFGDSVLPQVEETKAADAAVFGDVALMDVVVDTTGAARPLASAASNDWFPETATVHVSIIPANADGVTPQWYKVTVKVADGQWEVNKRYSEFRALRKQLRDEVPETTVMPAFPSKQRVATMFSSISLDDRRAGLNTFLEGVLADPQFHGVTLACFLDPELDALLHPHAGEDLDAPTQLLTMHT